MSSADSRTKQHRALVAISAVALGPGYGDGPPAVVAAGRGLPVVLVDCLLERAVVGQSKYGRLLPIGWPLATAGAFQEALDLLVYLASDKGSLWAERWMARWLLRSLARRLNATWSAEVQ